MPVPRTVPEMVKMTTIYEEFELVGELLKTISEKYMYDTETYKQLVNRHIEIASLLIQENRPQ